jgi:hypothetical protein
VTFQRSVSGTPGCLSSRQAHIGSFSPETLNAAEWLFGGVPEWMVADAAAVSRLGEGVDNLTQGPSRFAFVAGIVTGPFAFKARGLVGFHAVP